MMRFIPMTGVYSTSSTEERKADHVSVVEGLEQLKGLVDTAIVYFRPWMIEDGTLAGIISDAKKVGIRVIPGMRPDLEDQGYETWRGTWSQRNWDEVARLMKAAMKIADTRHFFAVMEPGFDPEKPPAPEEFSYAMKTMFATGANVIMDRPYVDHQHVSRDLPWLSLAKSCMTKWWTVRTMTLAAAMPGSYSLIQGGMQADMQRWDARESAKSVVRPINYRDRYFVTEKGMWPGKPELGDYMRVTHERSIFDFIDTMNCHEDNGDPPPIAYIPVDQFVAVCNQIREAVTNG